MKNNKIQIVDVTTKLFVMDFVLWIRFLEKHSSMHIDLKTKYYAHWMEWVHIYYKEYMQTADNRGGGWDR